MCLKEKEREMTLQKIAIVGPTTFRIMQCLGNIGTIGSRISCCNNCRIVLRIVGLIKHDKNAEYTESSYFQD